MKKYGCENRILDVGCGTGNHAIILSNKGYDVTGLDVSREYLTDFKEHTKARNAGVNIIRADMRRVPFKEQFGAAICIYSSFLSLRTADDMRAALQSIYEALVAGGLFILDIWNGWQILRSFAKRQRVLNHQTYHTDSAKILRLGKSTMNDERFLLEEIFSYLVIDKETNAVNLFDEKIALRIITLSELYWMLASISFEVLNIFNGFSFRKASGNSTRLISVSVKVNENAKNQPKTPQHKDT